MTENNLKINYCTDCGTEIVLNSKYCYKCGKQIIIKNEYLEKSYNSKTTNNNINNKLNHGILAFSWVVLIIGILAFIIAISNLPKYEPIDLSVPYGTYGGGYSEQAYNIQQNYEYAIKKIEYDKKMQIAGSLINVGIVLIIISVILFIIYFSKRRKIVIIEK